MFSQLCLETGCREVKMVRRGPSPNLTVIIKRQEQIHPERTCEDGEDGLHSQREAFETNPADTTIIKLSSLRYLAIETYNGLMPCSQGQFQSCVQ